MTAAIQLSQILYVRRDSNAECIGSTISHATIHGSEACIATTKTNFLRERERERFGGSFIPFSYRY
jgi:hypothetical protein